MAISPPRQPASGLAVQARLYNRVRADVTGYSNTKIGDVAFSEHRIR